MQPQVIEERHSKVLGRGRAPKKGPRYWLVAIPLILLLIGAAVGTVIRLNERRALKKETETLAVPSVVVIHPKAEASNQDLTLPSTLQAYTEAPIYARTNGYLAKWFKDIGSHVRKGDLLAEIETPEIDQELMQARSARDQTAVQLNLAKTSAQRWEALHQQDAVSQQETDERTSAYHQG
ncbi:MAG: biotin/lipoyl-binding protein, partial [Acidobacteriales bacterium]|nr:biotin/lipoyl-binding protein [Terriglobales bacterium]